MLSRRGRDAVNKIASPETQIYFVAGDAWVAWEGLLGAKDADSFLHETYANHCASRGGNFLERKQMTNHYKNLYRGISEILYRHDPIGINFDFNTNEYEPEVGAILPRISEATSPIELSKIVHQEFVRWFDEDTAGSEERYSGIAQEIWDLWEKFKTKSTI